MSRLETINTPIGAYAPDFELPDIYKQVHHLSRYLENFSLVCVVSMSNKCSYVEKYIDRLKSIQSEFSPHSFTLIGLTCGSENNGETLDSELNLQNMKEFAEGHELNFPYLWDTTEDVTHSLGATTTGTAFLIDHDGILRYKGQIDDHPQDPSASGVDYLKNAIACLLQGQEITPAETPQVGTPIVWRK
jgi:peroxiredoxin